MSRGRPRYGHACMHTWPRYRRWAQVLGRRAQAAGGRWADWALGPGARGRRAAAGAGVGAHGARGAGGSDARGALARQAQGRAGSRLGRAGRPAGLPVRTSWARLGVLVHLTQFLAWFNSVLFVSH